MRKHTFPSELENLTDAQLDQLHQWLAESPYHVALARLETEFGVQMSTTKLCRYLQKLEFVEAINGDSETQLQVRDLIDILNGQRTPYDEATLAVISKKNFEYLLRQPEITVNKLMLCHRIATYKASLDITQRRLALNELKKGITPPSTAASTKAPNQSITSDSPVPNLNPNPNLNPRPSAFSAPSAVNSSPSLLSSSAPSASSASKTKHPKRPVIPPVTNQTTPLPAPLTDAEWSTILSQAPHRPSTSQAPSSPTRHRARPTTVRQALSSASDDPNAITYPVSSFLRPPPAPAPLPSPSELRRLHSLLPAEILSVADAAPLPLAA